MSDYAQVKMVIEGVPGTNGKVLTVSNGKSYIC